MLRPHKINIPKSVQMINTVICDIWTFCPIYYSLGPVVDSNSSVVTTLKPEQNGWQFADDIYKCICINEKYCTSNNISLKCISGGLIDIMSTSFQIMTWCPVAPSHYLNWCWPDYMMPCVSTRSYQQTKCLHIWAVIKIIAIFTDVIQKWIVLKRKYLYLLQIQLNFVLRYLVDRNLHWFKLWQLSWVKRFLDH